MNCRRVNQSLSAYIDGELPGMEHRLIHEHITHCEECRTEHESLYRTKMLVSRLRMCEPRPELPQAILHRLGSEVQSASPFQVALQEHWLQFRALLLGRNFAIGAGLAAVGILFVATRVEPTDEIQWASQPANAVLMTANLPALDGPSFDSPKTPTRVDFEIQPEGIATLPNAGPVVMSPTPTASPFSARPMLIEQHL